MKTTLPKMISCAFVMAMCGCNGPNNPANTESIVPLHQDSMPILKPPVNDTNSAVITPPVNDPNVINPDSMKGKR